MEDQKNTFHTEHVQLLLTTYKAYHYYSRTEILYYLQGGRFRIAMRTAADKTDVEVGKEFLSNPCS
jgi:cupin superfamily acireductone dioxygenase involved in methionine salvage